MGFKSLLALFVSTPILLLAQQQTAGTLLSLNDLISEALRNNPELRASMHEVDAAGARVHQSGVLDDPELMYMQEGFPGLHFDEAMFTRLELSQMIRFPTKLARETEIAEINVQHAHHDLQEKELDIIAKVRMAYVELWYAQQAATVNVDNARLVEQFVTIAKTKYGVGSASMQDVLKSNVELARLQNQKAELSQQEAGARAMLVALLGRGKGDSLGTAVLPGEVTFGGTLDSLERLALESRPMLQHDSLMVQENRTMLSLSHEEYLPDLRLAVQYMTVPTGDFRGWAVSAGITLPFSPWTLGRTSAKVEEAEAAISRSQETFNASRNMVLSDVTTLYAKAQSMKQQLDAYRTTILPQAQMSLKASMTGYQTGGTDILMLIDAYRTLLDLSMESLMLRMQFEQTIAGLDREVGVVSAGRQ